MVSGKHQISKCGGAGSVKKSNSVVGGVELKTRLPLRTPHAFSGTALIEIWQIVKILHLTLSY